ncbi:MAG: hypothetical protein CMP72_03865 [Flavobacteriales bacterium]|nr:hypothetical protein [Flavobacteriales bacterium]|tara:strand:+ start:1967 stop:2218 length:252 start_codon:yes stop_codon:yes gene_type:complete
MITNKKIINKVEAALDEIRPYLRTDGGDISLIEITDDYTVKVKLMGACETCHVSMMTLKNGVEVAVKNAVPKVKKVVEIGSLN